MDKEDLEALEPFLPVRKRTGKEPQMTGPRVRGARRVGELSKKEEHWKHKMPPSSDEWKRFIMGMMAQIGVASTCYCYTFGGEIFHQKKGGPIGDRLTMAVALLVMEYLWMRLREMVEA